MIHACILILVVLFTWYAAVRPHGALNFAVQTNKPSIRVAIVGFTRSKPHSDSRGLESALADTLTRDPRVTLIDQSLVQSAIAGIGYDGSINLTKDEARRIGASISCDFFIIGKAEVFTRSEHANESHEQAYAGVMLVDGRTGALTVFDFISNKSSTKEAAQQSLVKDLNTRVGGYVDKMTQLRAQSSVPQSNDSSSPASRAREVIEDIPGEDSTRSEGFKPPEFLNRVKPDYTAEADLSDVTATVEAMVVFGSTGEVGRIEITRWAGFGLEESSEKAIRLLKFKPATRDGNPITVRAMIRYNFRRVASGPSKTERQVIEPPSKSEVLRDLFRQTFRRPR